MQNSRQKHEKPVVSVLLSHYIAFWVVIKELKKMSLRSISTFFSVFSTLVYISILLFMFSEPGSPENSDDKVWIYLFLTYPFIVFALAFVSSNFKLPKILLHLIAVILVPFLIFSLFLLLVRPFTNNFFELIPLLLGIVFSIFTIVWYSHYYRIISRSLNKSELFSFNLAQHLTAAIKSIIYPTTVAFLFFFILMVFDMHFLRGYAFEKVFLRHWTYYSGAEKIVKNFEYHIFQNSDGTWHFFLINDNPNYYYITCYRNGKLSFTLKDSLLFEYATRGKFEMGNKILEDDDGFACGTGLAPILIRPYEKFNWNFESLYDLVHDHHYWELKEEKIDTDSISLRFFLPVYALNSEKPCPVYSNSITINYEKLMKVLSKKNKHFQQAFLR